MKVNQNTPRLPLFLVSLMNLPPSQQEDFHAEAFCKFPDMDAHSVPHTEV
jgi:hypothetical protein